MGPVFIYNHEDISSRIPGPQNVFKRCPLVQSNQETNIIRTHTWNTNTSHSHFDTHSVNYTEPQPLRFERHPHRSSSCEPDHDREKMTKPQAHMDNILEHSFPQLDESTSERQLDNVRFRLERIGLITRNHLSLVDFPYGRTLLVRSKIIVSVVYRTWWMFAVVWVSSLIP
jgi:hypothetical protein